MGDTELMACTERKLQGPLDKIEGEKKKKKARRTNEQLYDGIWLS